MKIISKLKEWLFDSFGKDEVIRLSGNTYEKNKCSLYFAEMAIDRAVSFIAGSISKCEFKTYLNGKSIKERDYYDWNIRPNLNENASQFKYRIVKKILLDGEALVVTDSTGNYWIADSLYKEDRKLEQSIFKSVSVNDYMFQKEFKMSDVFYYKLEDDDIIKLMHHVFSLYSDVLGHAIDSYQEKNTKKIKAKLDSSYTSDAKKKETFEEIITKQLKPFLETRSAVLPEYEGMNFEEFGNFDFEIEAKEIAEIRKDMFDMVANSFKIPKNLFYGDVADLDSVQDTLIALAIEPITNMIEQVNTTTMFGYEGWMEKRQFKVDTSKIKYFNLFKIAPNVEKLISSGFMCIDETREEANLEELGTEWSRQHFMTKNFTNIEEVLRQLAGEKGGSDEQI